MIKVNIFEDSIPATDSKNSIVLKDRKNMASMRLFMRK